MIDPASLMAGMARQLNALGEVAGGQAGSLNNMLSATGAASGTSGSFADTLKDAVGRVDSLIATGESNSTRFAAGDPDMSLSDVMVSVEKANLSFQAASTVRDRAVDAYQSIMNMQV